VGFTSKQSNSINNIPTSQLTPPNNAETSAMSIETQKVILEILTNFIGKKASVDLSIPDAKLEEPGINSIAASIYTLGSNRLDNGTHKKA
jgi:hypothetical protein